MTVDDFVLLVRGTIGLDVTVDDLGTFFHDLPEWDSLHLVWLSMAVERETHRAVSLPDVLEAGTLDEFYVIAVAPETGSP